MYTYNRMYDLNDKDKIFRGRIKNNEHNEIKTSTVLLTLILN